LTEHFESRVHWELVASALTIVLTILCGGSTVSAASAAEVCPNEARRSEQGSLGLALPDCRAYELASPGSLLPQNGGRPARASITGNAITYYTSHPASDATSSNYYYVSTRRPEGWRVNPVPPQVAPAALFDGICDQNVFFSLDLSENVDENGWFNPDEPARCKRNETLVPEEPFPYRNVFLHNIATGSNQLVNVTPSGVAPANAKFQDASDDFSHIIFGEEAQLTSDSPAGYNFYLWVKGVVRLVTFLPDGSPAVGELVEATDHPSPYGDVPGSGFAPFTGAVSGDGRRIFFYSGGSLYLRENADAPQSPVSGGGCTNPSLACTIQIDASEGAGPGGGGVFWRASSDGSKVFFTDSSRLTTDSTAASDEADLYEYDLNSQQLTDLTIGAGGPAGVIGIAGASDDGSYLYFVANGVLAPGASPGSCRGEEETGQTCNLYLVHGDSIAFVATVLRADHWLWQEDTEATADAIHKSGDLWANTSSSGKFFAFSSYASLTGYDNHDAESGDLDREIFLYDATANGGDGWLDCVSCPPGPTNDPSMNIVFGGNYSYTSSDRANWKANAVLDDGRVFFDTKEALVAKDTNGLSDVYEYRAGQHHLISSGTSAGGAHFLDASPSGSDVFFQTPQSLVPSDADSENASLYDARVDGGFAEVAPSTPPCEGESCRQPASPAPESFLPGTSQFGGLGRLKPKRRRKHHRGKHRRDHPRHRSARIEYKLGYVDSEHFSHEGGYASRSTPLSELGGVATSADGAGEGADQASATAPVVEIGDPWVYAHFDSATVEAMINPRGLDTTCEVQFVSKANFELSGYANASAQPCPESLGAGSAYRLVRVELSDLRSSTTYHFRFVASNSSGSLDGSDKSFDTFGIESFSMEVVDGNDHPFTQAGGYPFESVTHYRFNHTFVPSQFGTAGSIDAFLKNVLTEQPPGRVGSVTATPRCAGFAVDEELCSPDTQVGTITTEYFEGATRNKRTRALYNVLTPKGIASRQSSIDPYISTDTYIRTGTDYGTTAAAFNITEEARIVGVTARIWGVPADPAHNAERRCSGGGSGCASKSPPLPMLRNPTSCGGSLTGKATVDTWQEPGELLTANAQMPAITGCSRVKFNPTIEWQPTTGLADSPSGLHINIHIPQNEDPEKLGVADLRDVVIPATDGLILNPAGANDLVGCSPGQVDLHSERPANCPDAARVGSVEVRTPLLDHPLHGGIYIATPHRNPFDSLFAIYVAINDPESGVVVKLAGKIEADPQNGQLRTTFTENPQLPIEDFKLDFFSGPRAVLRTPSRCGAYRARSTLTPWSAPESGPPVDAVDSFRVAAGPNGGPCVSEDAHAPNTPAFHAGTIRPVAGAYSAFVLHLNREDRTQQIANLTFSPPPGLLGRLAGLAYCPEGSLAAVSARSGEAELAKPSCPKASEVGTVNIGVGAGTAPYYVQGKAYVAGPYKGAPLSLATVVPAVVGPYDLGNALVRTALYVDLETAQITARSDPIPKIWAGISLDVRSISLRLDRPGFTLNPTKCSPMSVAGQITSVFSQAVSLADSFRVGKCRRLGFSPHLRLRLFGKTHRGAHPSLRAVLKMPKGGTNIKRVAVTLPPSQFLDNEHIRGICTREQFSVDACPAGSIYGYAEAWSPLLDRPLKGPVYLRSSNHRLPDLLADLKGQIRFALDGRIDSALGGIRANIEGVPDAPVSKFMLTMKGGAKGLLQSSTDVCAKPQPALVEFEGQNGRIQDIHPMLRPKCAAAPGKQP
jgi:hypothetical protein